MRTIDFYVGNVICFILDAYEQLRKIYRKPATTPTRITNILVTKYLGMGSIILATPTLRALRNAYPASKIVLLTFEPNNLFAKHLSFINEVRYFRTSSFMAFASDILSILPALRREEFDLVLDLEFFSRFSTIVSFLSCSKIRIGYYHDIVWRGDLLTHRINFNPTLHITEIFASQLKPLGIIVTDFSLAPPEITAESRSRVNSILLDYGVASGDHLIAMNINSSDLSPERRWPMDNFISLINEITRYPGRRMILTGAEEDADYVAEFFVKLPENLQNQVLNLSGRLPLEEFIALLQSVQFLISNDSGPLHIAASLGIPTVSFFGPETPAHYGPMGDNHLVFYAGLDCSPCLSAYNAKKAVCNGENRCMQLITVEEVIHKMEGKGLLLDQRSIICNKLADDFLTPGE